MTEAFKIDDPKYWAEKYLKAALLIEKRTEIVRQIMSIDQDIDRLMKVSEEEVKALQAIQPEESKSEEGKTDANQQET